MNRYILLSFDVEEFDVPLEYGFSISPGEQMSVGKRGLDAILNLLHQTDVKATMFTTANFAMQFPEAIKQIAAHHELGSHTFYHSSFKMEDLLLSKQKLEEISNTKVFGLRMPRMQTIDMNEVRMAGYLYDSSIHPTWLPGRYNNSNLPRTIYKENGVTRLPASVSPHLRIPLFWLTFKNFSYPLFKQIALQTLRHDGYLCLYLHPWEFVDIHGYQLPAYVRRLCGRPLREKLIRLISDLQKEGEFIGINDYLQKI
jgi:Predicted xylanase/chitin deacetylase